MNKTIQQWFSIIETMQNSNTYKPAWGRAILEICYTKSDIDKQPFVEISLEDIALKMLKYYWNQTYYFNLKQGPKNQQPEIVSIVKEGIFKYQEYYSTNIPIWFNKAETILIEIGWLNDNLIRRIVRILKQDVSWRFLKVMGSDMKVYDLDSDRETVTMTSDQIIKLKDFAPLLVQLINYKWVQLLEKYNHSPRLAHKVRGSADQTIKRKNLSKYREILLKQFEDKPIIDFYTGTVLKENDISLDHVIPWSFMYSDDIWNIVITSKSINSKKSNLIVRESYIKKLVDEKRALLELLPEGNKHHSDLKEAIENNYIIKYYNDFRI